MWAVPSVFPQGGTQFLFEVGVTHADGFSLCTVHLGLDHTGAFKFFQCACNDRLRDVSLCGDQIEEDMSVLALQFLHDRIGGLKLTE